MFEFPTKCLICFNQLKLIPSPGLEQFYCELCDLSGANGTFVSKHIYYDHVLTKVEIMFENSWITIYPIAGSTAKPETFVIFNYQKSVESSFRINYIDWNLSSADNLIKQIKIYLAFQ